MEREYDYSRIAEPPNIPYVKKSHNFRLVLDSPKNITPVDKKIISPLRCDDICSLCKNNIFNQLHSVCETCGGDLFVVCENCMDEDFNHDDTHKFVLYNPNNKILKKLSIDRGECSTSLSKSNSNRSMNNMLSPRHALLERELSKNSIKPENNSGDIIEMMNDILELEFKSKTNEDWEIETISDSESEIGSTHNYEDIIEIKRDFMEKNAKNINIPQFSQQKKMRQNLANALKNSHQNLSIEDLIQRCCDDPNEIHLFLDELMIGNFNKNFIDSIKKNLLNHIKILYLNKNKLSDFNPYLFTLSHIIELNLGENSFKKIPEEIGNLTNLTILNIGSNQLVDLPYGLSRLQNLKKLYADFNNFRQVPPVIMDIPNLEILHLQYNSDITSFPPIEKMSKMQNLEIRVDNSPDLMNEWKKYTSKYTLKNISISWNHAYPNNIVENLYLGGIQSTWNDYVYKYFDINTVFTIGRDLKPLILDGMVHKEYIIDDLVEVKMNFGILAEIHKNLLSGNKCLIHCFAGISRSSTIVIAYLMKYKNMRLGEAYDLVKAKRPQIHPNEGFWKQLMELDNYLFPKAEKIDYTDWRV